MKYNVYHKTHYKYVSAVSSCQNLACLSPSLFESQEISDAFLSIKPKPSFMGTYIDSLNNLRTYFSIPEEHRELEIISTFTVFLKEKNYPLSGLTPYWRDVAYSSLNPRTPQDVKANEFLYPTSYTESNEKIKQYAQLSFLENRTILEAANDLLARMFKDFTFDNKATEVESKPETLIENKKGVCQDFAHFFISCMRAMSIPAKYVSGYILTHPLEGTTKLFGADASHAWVSVYCQSFGWVELDPTNNLIVGNEHIKLAEGRDYHDIPPVKGVFLGNSKHTLKIAVDVSPVY
ncbi:MAG: transglutaminase family protein [Lentisphaeraceae bacterium]|nr:transglutaminase family protein [Lentisphaeraceae bacterium]